MEVSSKDNNRTGSCKTKEGKTRQGKARRSIREDKYKRRQDHTVPAKDRNGSEVEVEPHFAWGRGREGKGRKREGRESEREERGERKRRRRRAGKEGEVGRGEEGEGVRRGHKHIHLVLSHYVS